MLWQGKKSRDENFMANRVYSIKKALRLIPKQAEALV
jgi:hypothetical protein